MIQIQINKKTEKKIVNIEHGFKALDLLDINEKKNYYACLVNGRVRELTYKVNDKDEVEFLDLSNQESCKIYEATLRFLFAMAFKKLYPKKCIRFSYNVSRSIFCQLTNDQKMEKHMIDEISIYLKDLIKEDLPIERATISKKEAADSFKKNNMHDKIDILKYRPEKDVHLYRCGDYFNYMYSYMLPSTGFIKDYIIKQYSPGFILQYPRYELNGVIPKFEEAPIYGRTIKRAYEWSKSIDTQTIAKINEQIVKGNPTDFIQTCETKHNNMLAELGTIIKSDIENIRLIAIAGPSSSGKTTFSNRLRIELMSRGIKPVMISIDDYYLDRDKIKPNDNGEIDLEDINTLDIDLFNQHMYSLINGEEVEIPHFDFTLAKRVKGKKIKVNPNSPIIIEGIHALNEQLSSLIPKHQKFKIFISPQIQISIDNHSPISTTDLRLIRRIVRDHQFRNSKASKTIDMWPSVRRGEFKWIYPNQEQSNYVFNSELTYELCVLKKYATPLLKEIGPESKYFIMANRLLKYLKYFKTLDEDAIPCNSLIREFIGGSCFNV